MSNDYPVSFYETFMRCPIFEISLF